MLDLADELGREERDDVEWKRDGDDRDLLRKAVCALANDLPARGGGHLLLGVRNDGTPTRLRVDDRLLLQVTNIRDEARVLPRPVMVVEKTTFAGSDCVHVAVETARMRPVRFDGVVWVRAGTSTRRATREEELVLAERTRSGELSSDQRAIGGTSARDLDLELFRSTYLPAAVGADVLAENDRTVEQQLSSLGVLDPDSAEARVLGLLLVGFDASAFVPGAYTSPGGPYGVVTKETFAERNDYRNPALAAAMKTLGYVNRFGRGILGARRS